MDNIKVNLTVLVQGATLVSEQECSKQLKKPIINKKGKYAGKQARDKEGNLLWYYETVTDFSKLNRHIIKMESSEEKKEEDNTLVIYTRKNREIMQTVNISQEAYNSFIDGVAPLYYQAPKDFKPYNSKLPIAVQAWRQLSKKQRLEWHLNDIAKGLGGRMGSYAIFED